MVPNLRFPIFHFDWNENYFGNICTIRSGIGFKADEYVEQGVPLLKIDNVGYGNIKWNNISYLPETYLKQYPFLKLNENDIVLALNRPITNNQLKISKLTSKDIPSILYQRVGKINVSSDYNLDYIYYLLTKNVFDFVLKTSIGSDQPFISTENLKKLIMKVPTITEQQKIGHFLSLIDQRIQTQIKIIDSYFSLSKAISNTLIGQSKGNTRLRECLNCYSSNTMESVIKQEDLGDYPVYGANGIIKKINNYEIEYPSIAIVKDGSGVGKIFKLSGKYSILSTLNYLTSKPGYDIDYIYYALKQKSLKKYVVGSGIPHIYFKDYEQEKIYIPQNELQQHNITSVLQSIDEEIGNEIKQLKNYELLKKYLLKNMFV